MSPINPNVAAWTNPCPPREDTIPTVPASTLIRDLPSDCYIDPATWPDNWVRPSQPGIEIAQPPTPSAIPLGQLPDDCYITYSDDRFKLKPVVSQAKPQVWMVAPEGFCTRGKVTMRIDGKILVLVIPWQNMSGNFDVTYEAVNLSDLATLPTPEDPSLTG